MSAAGSGASMVSQNNALQKQDQIAAQGIARQSAINKQASQQVSGLTKTVAADDPTAIAANLKAQYAAALQNNSTDTEPGVSGSSKRYGEATTTANQNIGAYGGQQAGLDATVNAPTLQRLQDQEQIGSTAGNLGLLQNQSNNQEALTQTEIKSVAANPWLSAIGGVLKGAGAGVGAYGAATAATAGAGNALNSSSNLDVNAAPGADAFAGSTGPTYPMGIYGK
jgi:hypothetical protein